MPKVRGEFEYSSDMHVDGMLWGATLRSPHPRADIWSIDTSAAVAMPGVRAVLTHDDVPGRKTYGMEIADQPVLAWKTIRYQGEAIAIVAADDPETARRAVKAIKVEYDVLPPLTDAEAAMKPDAPQLHLSGNTLRHLRINHGNPDATAPVVVTGTYEVGMQDQAFLGPESGLAIPDDEGGVDLHIATQWLHVDRDQVAESLGLPHDKVRLSMGGVGGAFGGREDLSMQVHACMLALHTGRPVKVVYNRTESFYGHVHRHPAKMYYEHGADHDGNLLYVRAKVVLDGGAYASSSPAVASQRRELRRRPVRGAERAPGRVRDVHEQPAVRRDARLRRGPGRVRPRGADGQARGRAGHGPGRAADQERDGAGLADADRPGRPDAGAGRRAAREAARHADAAAAPAQRDIRELPGGVANTTDGEGVVRGVGYAVSFKNVGFSEGFDDYSTARVRLELDDDGEPIVEVHTAAAEVGQGVVTVQAQIARTELGVERVVVRNADTQIGSAGSSSASRQTYVTGGAVKAACEAVRERWEAHGELQPGDVIEETLEWRHKPTYKLDANGQGDAHFQFAFSAHRAVVDVDVELGLVRVVELATTQEVGKAMNPQALEGQIEGGSAQGLGLALLEEIQVKDGKVMNASFTDYLLPTILDMPPVRMELLEHADPDAPYGLKGVGEPPNISTPPAVAAALRDATGKAVARIPVRPEHLI